MKIKIKHFDDPEQLKETLKHRFGLSGLSLSINGDHEIEVEVDEDMVDHLNTADLINIANDISHDESGEFITDIKVVP